MNSVLRKLGVAAVLGAAATALGLPLPMWMSVLA
jgi:hypothetical protein